MSWWRRRRRRLRPKTVSVAISFPLVGTVSGTWEPRDAERQAATDLYIELVTRVTGAKLPSDQGKLREALSSLYTIFDTTRTIYHKYGGDVIPQNPRDDLSFATLAHYVTEESLRPLLTYWHPELEKWEWHKPADDDPVTHERNWARAPELRAAIEEMRQALVQLAGTLAEVAEIDDLLRLS